MLNCLLLSNNKTRVSEFNKQTMFLSIVGPRGSIGDFPIQGHMIIFTDSGSDGNTSYSTSSLSSPLSLAKGGIDLKSLLENDGITLTLSSTGINVGSSLDDIDLHVRLIFFLCLPRFQISQIIESQMKYHHIRHQKASNNKNSTYFIYLNGLTQSIAYCIILLHKSVTHNALL